MPWCGQCDQPGHRGRPSPVSSGAGQAASRAVPCRTSRRAAGRAPRLGGTPARPDPTMASEGCSRPGSSVQPVQPVQQVQQDRGHRYRPSGPAPPQDPADRPDRRAPQGQLHHQHRSGHRTRWLRTCPLRPQIRESQTAPDCPARRPSRPYHRPQRAQSGQGSPAARKVPHHPVRHETPAVRLPETPPAPEPAPPADHVPGSRPPDPLTGSGRRSVRQPAAQRTAAPPRAPGSRHGAAACGPPPGSCPRPLHHHHQRQHDPQQRDDD